MYRYEEEEKDFPVAISESPSCDINVHFIRIPFVFEENEPAMKETLKNVIKEIFDITILCCEEEMK